MLAVIQHFGQEKAIICGHDWGGLVAWAVAMEHPEVVDRLIVCDLPHPRGFVRELVNNPKQRMSSFYACRFQSSDPNKIRPEAFFVLVKLEPRSIARGVLRRSKLQCGDDAKLLQGEFSQDPAEWLARDFPQVKCPVLIFHGRNDLSVLPAGLAVTWDWVDNEVTIVTFPDAGHWVHFDRAEDVTKRMLSWLDQGSRPQVESAGPSQIQEAKE